MSLGVCARCGDGTASFDGAVEVDDVVIADVCPSIVADVPLTDVSCTEVLAFDRGGAMDDDEVDVLQFLHNKT